MIQGILMKVNLQVELLDGLYCYEMVEVEGALDPWKQLTT